MVNKTAIHEYQKESKRGTSNLLYEMIYSIAVFKINVRFEKLKEELPNNSTSENLESFRFKILLLMFRMLSMGMIKNMRHYLTELRTLV